MTRSAHIEIESRNLLAFLRESIRELLNEMVPEMGTANAPEKVAESIMHACAEYAYVTAECAVDVEHGCVVIWSESAMEHIAAMIQEHADRGRNVRLAELLAVRLQALDKALAQPLEGPVAKSMGEGPMQDRRSY